MWLIVICAVLAAVLYYRQKQSRLVQLGEKFPGPKCWPLIQNALEFGYSTTDLPIEGERLFLEHGPRLRFWIANGLYIILINTTDVEVVLGSNTLLDKAKDYNFLKPWIGTGLLTSTGDKWRKHRKILTPTFHFKILEEFVDVFNNNGDILVELLKQKVDGPTFDVYKYVNLYALDNICETAMGIQMNAQRDRTSAYVTAVRDMSEVVMLRTFRPWLRFDATFRFFPEGRLHARSLKVLHEVSNRVVKTRKAEIIANRAQSGLKSARDDSGVKRRLAFLDLLIQGSLDGNNLTDEDIREEVDTFMLEGHDTTASAIGFTLFLLSQNPHIQDKAVAELDAIFPDINTPLAFRDLQEMKYLERVLKEALRMFPSVPVFAREVTEDIVLPDGLVIPTGATVLMTPYNIHRDPDIFKNPEEFNPDRFLPENVKGRHPYAYVPFSAGPRNCIGQKFAMMELKAAISHMLRHFKLLPAPADEGIQLAPELITKSKTGMRLKIVSRQRQ